MATSKEKASLFEPLPFLAVSLRELDIRGRTCAMVTEDRVVPAFNVEVGIVPSSKEGVNDFGPISLAEAGKAMFGYARMA